MSELCVGRVIAVREHPGARAPSYLVTLDLGPHGRHDAVLPAADYEPGRLEGRQLLCRRDVDDVIVVAAHSHAGGLVLLGPDREVEDGTLVA